jgi:hypothetical protein
MNLDDHSAQTTSIEPTPSTTPSLAASCSLLSGSPACEEREPIRVETSNRPARQFKSTKRRVKCEKCLRSFCDKGALKIHTSAVHLKETHVCTVEGCNRVFSSRRSRNRHSSNPNLHTSFNLHKMSNSSSTFSHLNRMQTPIEQALNGSIPSFLVNWKFRTFKLSIFSHPRRTQQCFLFLVSCLSFRARKKIRANKFNNLNNRVYIWWQITKFLYPIFVVSHSLA